MHAAGLEYPLFLANRFDHRPRFMNRLAQRLLAVDVLARSGGGGRDQRVPMVGRRDDHRIDVFSRQQLAEVVVRRAAFVRAIGLFGVEILDLFLCVFAPAGIHVAHGHCLGFLLSEKPIQQSASLRSQADETKSEAFGRFDFGRPDARWEDKRRRHAKRGGRAEKFPASQKLWVFHGMVIQIPVLRRKPETWLELRKALLARARFGKVHSWLWTQCRFLMATCFSSSAGILRLSITAGNKSPNAIALATRSTWRKRVTSCRRWGRWLATSSPSLSNRAIHSTASGCATPGVPTGATSPLGQAQKLSSCRTSTSRASSARFGAR